MGLKHDEKDKFNMPIEAGIENLAVSFDISRGGKLIAIMPRISLSVTTSEQRGLHMSKLQRCIQEVLALSSGAKSIEAVGYAILKDLDERMLYKDGAVSFSFDYPLNMETPVSKLIVREIYPIKIEVRRKNGDYFVDYYFTAIGATCCPCAGHQQRAELRVLLQTSLHQDIPFKEVIKLMEESFSSETHGIVRTEDEHHMVETMKANPRFVEDTIRVCATKLKKYCKEKHISGHIQITTIAYDSIHKHNVRAMWEGVL